MGLQLEGVTVSGLNAYFFLYSLLSWMVSALPRRHSLRWNLINTVFPLTAFIYLYLPLALLCPTTSLHTPKNAGIATRRDSRSWESWWRRTRASATTEPAAPASRFPGSSSNKPSSTSPPERSRASPPPPYGRGGCATRAENYPLHSYHPPVVNVEKLEYNMTIR